ncbi:RDD family protein [Paenibacillus bouchesdurhonensis]|uniref:RDD family protein n=1 Tax=Paenibacillus bouchesdurhonensis TaxID=1870990 RepID=UPI000DA615BA|nr:RDD family protein [Paenibacillus bouchesdurhonensis]
MKQNHDDLHKPSYRPVSMLFRRIGATVIDYLLFAALIRSAIDIDKIFMVRNEFHAQLCVIALILFYYVLLEGLTGSTIGKWMMRIRVVDRDGAAPGLLKAFIRTVFRAIDSNPLLFAGLPAALGIVMTERRQRLGDWVARTYVIEVGRLPSHKLNRGREAVVLTLAATPILLAMILPMVVRLNPLSEGERSKETSYSDEKIHISHNGKFKITTSPDWLFDPNLDNQAEISISNRFSNKYLAVFSEPKKRFKRGSTLEQYQKYAEQSFAAALAHSPIYKPRPLIINGYHAYQFAVEQEVNGVKVAYIVTTIETKLYYHWITVWTDAAKYKEYQQELHSVISTFNNFTT